MNDVINAVFEGGASLFVLLSVIRAYKDKSVKGVSPVGVSFFAAWGYWNLYFYPSVDAWWSFVAGIGVTIINSVWVVMLFRYDK